jgi:hypothetical protein
VRQKKLGLALISKISDGCELCFAAVEDAAERRVLGDELMEFSQLYRDGRRRVSVSERFPIAVD